MLQFHPGEHAHGVRAVNPCQSSDAHGLWIREGSTFKNALKAFNGASQQAFVRQLLCSQPQNAPKVVIDADGLNNLAKLPHWWERIAPESVLTPHPGEHARLTGRSVADIQADRLSSARDAAAAWRQVVVLKGAYTIVAAPDGRVAVSPYANPALATAGTGDVLAGAIAGLLGQGLPPYEAACCGVYLHAAAAEGLKPDFGDAGLLASDLLPELPRTLRELRSCYERPRPLSRSTPAPAANAPRAASATEMLNLRSLSRPPKDRPV